MKTKDLMIGDWVLWHDEGWASDGSKWHEDIKSQVEGIEGDCLSLTRYDEHESYISEDCIDPIPLTEEILKMNGWILLETDNESVLGMVSFGCGDGSVKIEFFNDNISLYLEYIAKGNYVNAHIQNVHELQHALRLCGLNELADNFKIKDDRK